MHILCILIMNQSLHNILQRRDKIDGERHVQSLEYYCEEIKREFHVKRYTTNYHIVIYKSIKVTPNDVTAIYDGSSVVNECNKKKKKRLTDFR